MFCGCFRKLFFLPFLAVFSAYFFFAAFLGFLTNVQLTLDWRTINTISSGGRQQWQHLRLPRHHHHQRQPEMRLPLLLWQLITLPLATEPAAITRIKPPKKRRCKRCRPVDRTTTCWAPPPPLLPLATCHTCLLLLQMYRLFYLTVARLPSPPKN